MKKGFLEDNQYTGELLEHFTNFWNDYSNWVCVWNGRFYNSCLELDKPTINSKSRFYDTDEFIILDLKINEYTKSGDFLFDDIFYNTLVERTNKGSMILHISDMPAVYDENNIFIAKTPQIFEYDIVYKFLQSLINSSDRKIWLDIEIKGSNDVIENKINTYDTIDKICEDTKFKKLHDFIKNKVFLGETESCTNKPCHMNILVSIYNNVYTVIDKKKYLFFDNNHVITKYYTNKRER